METESSSTPVAMETKSDPPAAVAEAEATPE